MFITAALDAGVRYATSKKHLVCDTPLRQQCGDAQRGTPSWSCALVAVGQLTASTRRWPSRPSAMLPRRAW